MLEVLGEIPGPLLLPALSAGLFALIAWNRHQGEWAHPSRILSLLYLALSLSSLVTPARAETSVRVELRWETMAAYSVLLLVSLAPSLSIQRPRMKDIVMNPVVAPAVRWAWAPVGFALIYLFPSVLGSFRRGFSGTRELLNSQKGSPLVESSLTTLAVAISMFYLCFAVLTFASRARRLGILGTGACAAGVMLATVHAGAFAARDGVLWAGFAMLFGYWSTGPLPLGRRRPWAKLAGVVAIAGGFGYLALVTQERFQSSPGGYAGGTLGYFGAQPYVFEETVQRTTSYLGLALRFPLLAPAGGYVERTDAYQWSFGTFLSDFFAVGGWPYTIGLTVGGSLLVWVGLRVCRTRSALSYVLMAGLYAQFMVQGAFYYRLGNRPGNIYHLLMVGLIASLLWLLPDRRVAGRRQGSAVNVEGQLGRNEEMWARVASPPVRRHTR